MTYKSKTLALASGGACSTMEVRPSVIGWRHLWRDGSGVAAEPPNFNATAKPYI